jgi:hypothetical protein
MTKLRKLTALAGLAGLCATPNLRAEMASGSYTNTFTDTVRIWDVSGSYNNSVTGFGLNYTLNMDKSGKFAGKALINVSDEMDMNLSFFGAVTSGPSNVTRMTLTMRLKGTMDLESMSMNFSGLIKEKLEIDPNTGMMVGTMSGSVHVSIPKLGRSATQKIPVSDVSTYLPYGMNGKWDLTLNVQTNGLRYTGDGEVRLSNGRTVPLLTTGTYSAKTDLSKLNIKNVGTNGIVKFGLVSTVENGQLNIEKLLGSALGQKVRLLAPPTPTP